MSSLCSRAKEISNQAEIIAGRDVNIVIASKYADADRLKELVRCGFKTFGENKVQDLLEKAEQVKGAEWHFIGHLQRNKVKYIIGLVKLIQSVDSFRLAEEINKESEKKDIKQEILIQVNITGEETKYGVEPKHVGSLVNEVLKLNNIRVRGLMAIMPYDEPESLRLSFKELNKLFSNIRSDLGLGELKYLSAGMSNDWKTALEEGSNMLRLGSVIFGG